MWCDEHGQAWVKVTKSLLGIFQGLFPLGQSQWGVSWRSFQERKRRVNVNRNHSPQWLGFYTNHCETNDLNAAHKLDGLAVAIQSVQHILLPHATTSPSAHTLHTQIHIAAQKIKVEASINSKNVAENTLFHNYTPDSYSSP
jgi:hypothetical protein